MLRTTIAVIILCGVILWLPVWVQISLFAIAVILVPYRLVLLAPAVIADALYAPSSAFTVTHFKMTILVFGLLFIYWFITSYTRIQYGRTS